MSIRGISAVAREVPKAMMTPGAPRAPAAAGLLPLSQGKDGKDKEETYACLNCIKENTTFATGTREKTSHNYKVIKRNKIL